MTVTTYTRFFRRFHFHSAWLAYLPFQTVQQSRGHPTLAPQERVTRSFPLPRMSTDRPSTVGVCPLCETTIGRHDVLIEYERSEGTAGIYAECPDCRDVVTPA